MVRHFLTAAACLLAIVPSTVSAQEAPSPDSTGFRVEGLIGYDDAAFDSVNRGDGLLYGLGVGFDLGRGRLRLGVEAELSESSARNCVPLIGGPGEVCLRAARDVYAGVRVGAEVARGVLLYGKLGYTNFHESNRYPVSAGGIVTHPTFDGIRAGLGAEFAIGERLFVKTEYRYSHYARSQGFDRNQGVVGFGFRF